MSTRSQPPTNPERVARLLTMVTVLIVVSVLFVAREVLIPLALAMLFSFLLAPVVTRLERWRFGRIPAVLTTVLLAFCVLAGVGYLVFGQLYDLTLQLPKYKTNISAKIVSLKSRGKSPLSEADRHDQGTRQAVEEHDPGAERRASGVPDLREQGTRDPRPGRRAGDQSDDIRAECVRPGSGSPGHGGDCHRVRDVHAHQAGGFAGPHHPFDRPRPAQHDHTGTRRSGSEGERVPVHAVDHQRVLRHSGRDRLVLHRGAQRVSLGPAGDAAALRALHRCVDRAGLSVGAVAGGFAIMGDAD